MKPPKVMKTVRNVALAFSLAVAIVCAGYCFGTRMHHQPVGPADVHLPSHYNRCGPIARERIPRIRELNKSNMKRETLLLRLTGPPVPVTASVHSTPQMRELNKDLRDLMNTVQ